MTDARPPLPPREPAGVHDGLPPGWTVRTMEPADLDEVLAIEEASFTNPWTREMFAAELQNAGVSYLYVLQAETAGLVAFCTTWLVVDELHVNNIAVRPDSRGLGMGRALLEFVFRLAFGLGARRATLEVRRSNAVALKLYERMGFRVAGVRPNYYVSPVEDALILWLDRLPGSRAERGPGAA